MSLEHDIETIKEYTQWKAVRQDTSPEAFVKDRAQQTAYERLTAGIDYINAVYKGVDIGSTRMTEVEVIELWKLLNGTA
jgi:hypothetical protein